MRQGQEQEEHGRGGGVGEERLDTELAKKAERKGMNQGTANSKAEEAAMAERALERRKRIVGHYAKSWEDAENWDLEFWQKQGPEMRLSALVAIRNDIVAVRGDDPDFDWNDD
jgi:hypothetical protein